jgi:ammonium transporter, Amt family
MTTLMTILWWMGAVGVVLTLVGLVPGLYRIGEAAESGTLSVDVVGSQQSRKRTGVRFWLAAVLLAGAAAAASSIADRNSTGPAPSGERQRATPSTQEQSQPAIAPELPKPPDVVSPPPQNVAVGDVLLLLSAAAILAAAFPGSALFFSGLDARAGLSATLPVTALIAGSVFFIWLVIGYSISMTEGTPLIGGLTRAFFQGLQSQRVIEAYRRLIWVPETSFALFHTAIAMLASALVVSPFARRTRASFLLWFVGLWAILVYAPVAHWVWSPQGWLSNAGPGVARLTDVAGGAVVYLNAGLAGLVCSLRLKRARAHSQPDMALLVPGTLLLWVGGLALNTGMASLSGIVIGAAVLTSLTASVSAAFSWMFMEWAFHNRSLPSELAIGAFAGIVAIAAGCGVVGPFEAALIGVVASVLSFVSTMSREQQDASDFSRMYLIGGLVGLVLTGAFLSAGDIGRISQQLFGVSAIGVYDVVCSYLLWTILDWTIGSGVIVEDEQAVEQVLSGAANASSA